MFTFIATIMLIASLGSAAMTHAVEPATCADSIVSDGATGHLDGDADQVPADADNGFPHHHGSCHGHHVAVAMSFGSPVVWTPPSEAMHSLRSNALTSAALERALRPPRA